VVPVDNYRIFGTEGTLTVPDGNLWTYRQEDADERGLEVGWNMPMRREVVEVQEAIPFQQQTEHLARLVAGTEEPVCSGRDGLAAVKVCEAVATALAKNDGQPVDIKQL
jgi:predicted dehydrogenase